MFSFVFTVWCPVGETVILFFLWFCFFSFASDHICRARPSERALKEVFWTGEAGYLTGHRLALRHSGDIVTRSV